MFTGLIQDIGIIKGLNKKGKEAELAIETSLTNFVIGESIAVMGACLSITNINGPNISMFVSKETLDKTGIAKLKTGAKVNLERSLKIGDALDGHIVSGHVDTRIKLVSQSKIGDASKFVFQMPSGVLSKQIASKGSIAIDGVSLTINNVNDNNFDIMIIPITLKETTLGLLKAGDEVNIETDVLAKYIARQFEADNKPKDISLSTLENAGFMR